MQANGNVAPQGRARERARKSSTGSIGRESDAFPTPGPGGMGHGGGVDGSGVGGSGQGGGSGGGVDGGSGGGGGRGGARQKAGSLAPEDLRSEAALLEGGGDGARADDPVGVGRRVDAGGVRGSVLPLRLELPGVSPEGVGVSDLEAVLLVRMIPLPLPSPLPPPPSPTIIFLSPFL